MADICKTSAIGTIINNGVNNGAGAITINNGAGAITINTNVNYGVVNAIGMGKINFGIGAITINNNPINVDSGVLIINNNPINFGPIDINNGINNGAGDLVFREQPENLGNYDAIEVLEIGRNNLKIHATDVERSVNLGVNAKNVWSTSIDFFNGNLTIEQNSKLKTATTNSIKKIEIVDNLTVSLNIGFPIEEVELSTGELLLDFRNTEPCTTTLKFNKGSKFDLNSKSGFDMKIVIGESNEQVEYALRTNNTKISSDKINEVIELTEKINSKEDGYLFNLKQYVELTKDGFIHDLVQQNKKFENIDQHINDNYFTLTDVIQDIDKISKIDEKSNLPILPTEIMSHIASFLKLSDVCDPNKVITVDACNDSQAGVDTTGSVEEIDS